MNKLVAPALALVAIALVMAGCAGYQLGAVKPSSLAGVDRLFIPPFKNDTLEPRVSSLVTNAVIKQIQLDGTYRVTGRNEADAILRGRIQRIRKFQLRSFRDDTLRSQELGLYLYIDWFLEDPRTGERITVKLDEEFADGEKEVRYGDEVFRPQMGVVVGDTIQFVDPSFQVGERNAIAVAAEDAAKKLVYQLSQGW